MAPPELEEVLLLELQQGALATAVVIINVRLVRKCGFKAVASVVPSFAAHLTA